MHPLHKIMWAFIKIAKIRTNNNSCKNLDRTMVMNKLCNMKIKLDLILIRTKDVSGIRIANKVLMDRLCKIMLAIIIIVISRTKSISYNKINNKMVMNRLCRIMEARNVTGNKIYK